MALTSSCVSCLSPRDCLLPLLVDDVDPVLLYAGCCDCVDIMESLKVDLVFLPAGMVIINCSRNIIFYPVRQIQAGEMFQVFSLQVKTFYSL